jgi:hypothetical protein
VKNAKFVVKVNRGATLKPEYVQRIDRTPIQMTSDRKLALLMGRLTAEDAVKSIETTRRSSGLVSRGTLAVMRKRLITQKPPDSSSPNEGWLDLESAAVVEVTSEDKGYPIESALVSGEAQAGVPAILAARLSGSS